MWFNVGRNLYPYTRYVPRWSTCSYVVVKSNLHNHPDPSLSWYAVSPAFLLMLWYALLNNVSIPGAGTKLASPNRWWEHSNVVDLSQSTRPDINVWAIFTKPHRGFLPLTGGLSPRRLWNEILQNLNAPTFISWPFFEIFIGIVKA